MGTDFSIILEEGNEIKVHKYILAQNSKVFETIFNQELEEIKNNQVIIDFFDQETVKHFVEYLYAGLVNDPETKEKNTVGVGPDMYIYKRCFDPKKLTFNLLRMADW